MVAPERECQFCGSTRDLFQLDLPQEDGTTCSKHVCGGCWDTIFELVKRVPAILSKPSPSPVKATHTQHLMVHVRVPINIEVPNDIDPAMQQWVIDGTIREDILQNLPLAAYVERVTPRLG